MRLLYLLVDDLDPTTEELARLERGGQAAMPPGSTFTVAPIPLGPPHYHESAVGLALCVPGILEAVRERQAEHDAVLIGCFGDPGVRAARTIAQVPVIGSGQAATALVQTIADRFGIVTIMPSNIPDIEHHLASLELRHKCVGVEAIGLPFYALVRDPDDTLRRVEERAGPLLRRGAQAIVLGCMSFGFHPFARELSQRLGVPVVDALRAGIAAAYACTLLGVGPSAAAHPPLDEPERLAAYLADLRGAPAAT